MRATSHRRVVALILAVTIALLPACASMGVKQKAYATHQTLHSALVGIDHAERDVCGVDPTAPNHCLVSPPVLTNLQHQEISRRIIALYDIDEALSKMIVDWKPGMPVPTDVAAMQRYVTEIGALVRAIKPGPKTDALIAKATALATAAAQVALIFAGGVGTSPSLVKPRLHLGPWQPRPEPRFELVNPNVVRS